MIYDCGAIRIRGSLHRNLWPISHTVQENVQICLEKCLHDGKYTPYYHIMVPKRLGPCITLWLDSICFRKGETGHSLSASASLKPTLKSPLPFWAAGVRMQSNLNNFTIWHRGSGAEMAKDGMVAGERGRGRQGGREGGEAHSCSLSYINLRLFSFVGRLTLFPHRLGKLPWWVGTKQRWAAL